MTKSLLFFVDTLLNLKRLIPLTMTPIQGIWLVFDALLSNTKAWDLRKLHQTERFARIHGFYYTCDWSVTRNSAIPLVEADDTRTLPPVKNWLSKLLFITQNLDEWVWNLDKYKLKYGKKVLTRLERLEGKKIGKKWLRRHILCVNITYFGS